MDYHITDTVAVLLGIVVIWDIAWKGIAMWRASQQNQKFWYVAILAINSVGILPITYLLLNKEKANDPTDA